MANTLHRYSQHTQTAESNSQSEIVGAPLVVIAIGSLRVSYVHNFITACECMKLVVRQADLSQLNTHSNSTSVLCVLQLRYRHQLPHQARPDTEPPQKGALLLPYSPPP